MLPFIGENNCVPRSPCPFWTWEWDQQSLQNEIVSQCLHKSFSFGSLRLPHSFFLSFLVYLHKHHPPPLPLSTPLMPREACACMPTGTLKPTTPSPNRLHTHTHAHTDAHTHRVLFLSSHWSVTEATWQVTHTLDVIGSGPEIQPLEWWETVTRIVYLRYRRGERGMTERKRVPLSFFAVYHSWGKGGKQRKRLNLAPHWRQSLHVEYLATTSDSNNFWTPKTEKILMVWRCGSLCVFLLKCQSRRELARA